MAEARSTRVPTLQAVGFMLAILSLGIGFYHITRSNQIVAGMLDVEAASLRANLRSEAELQKQIDALQQRIQELEAKDAAATLSVATP